MFRIKSYKKRYTRDFLKGEQFEIGDYTYGVPEVSALWQGARLKIGRFCCLAGGIKIILGDNHRLDWVTTYNFPIFPDEWPESAGIRDYWRTKGDVVIGNDVWIGQDVTLLSGVTIGDGAVIGACSVVAKDVEPYAIVVGNPVRLVRKRFSDEIIVKLLELRWWDWPVEKIRRNVSLLCSNNIEALLRVKN